MTRVKQCGAAGPVRSGTKTAAFDCVKSSPALKGLSDGSAAKPSREEERREPGADAIHQPARFLVRTDDARSAVGLAGRFRQVALRTIPYSEFKTHLARGELSECIVEEDEITGKVTPKTSAEAGPQTGKAATGRETPFHFRSVRIEDPKLVEDLQKAGDKYSGVRPGILSHVLWAWLLPIAGLSFSFGCSWRIGFCG